MRRGVRGTGNHAVRHALVHHHGGEVGDVLHRLPSLLERDALLLAQLRKISRELFAQLGLEVVDHLRLGQVQALLVCAALNVRRVTQDGQLRHILGQQLVRGLQDAVIVALGQHDVRLLLLRATNQPRLKHLGAHHGLSRRVHLQGVRVKGSLLHDAREHRPLLTQHTLNVPGLLRSRGHEHDRHAVRGGDLCVEGVVAATQDERVAVREQLLRVRLGEGLALDARGAHIQLSRERVNVDVFQRAVGRGKKQGVALSHGFRLSCPGVSRPGSRCQ